MYWDLKEAVQIGFSKYDEKQLVLTVAPNFL